MKYVFGVALFLLAVMPVCSQAQQPIATQRLVSRYDRFTETTTVQCELIDLGEAPAQLTVQANASFSRTEAKGKPKVWLYLSSNRGGATRRTQPIFRQAETVCLMVDGARMELPVKNYRNTYYELIPAYAESARVEISRDDLSKLLGAHRLTACWGGVECEFSVAALASFKDFIAQQVFATHAP